MTRQPVTRVTSASPRGQDNYGSRPSDDAGSDAECAHLLEAWDTYIRNALGKGCATYGRLLSLLHASGQLGTVSEYCVRMLSNSSVCLYHAEDILDQRVTWNKRPISIQH